VFSSVNKKMAPIVFNWRHLAVWWRGQDKLQHHFWMIWRNWLSIC